MRQITTSQAKKRLSELLEAVSAGETIEIVRRGHPAAWLVPVPRQDARFPSPRSAADWLRENRAKVAAEDVRMLRTEGRP